MREHNNRALKELQANQRTKEFSLCLCQRWTHSPWMAQRQSSVTKSDSSAVNSLLTMERPAEPPYWLMLCQTHQRSSMLRVRLALVEMLLTWSPSMPKKDYQLSSLVASLMILNSNLSSITAGSLISQSLAVTQHKGLKRTQRRHAVSSSPPRLHQNQQLQLERPILLNSTKMMRKRRRTVKLEPKISKTSRNSQTF